MKSGSKGRERSRRTSLIRATAFFIYTPTDTPKHLLFTSLRLHYLWGAGERHRREEERRGAKICIGAGSSGTAAGSQSEGGRREGRKDLSMYVSETEGCERWRKPELCMQRERQRRREGLKSAVRRERG